ncbi:MAG: hypothetical protein Q8K64_01300 [Sediminibacterium sp.]|nr:hypothetical protein [Sediminibacterium sp.]
MNLIAQLQGFAEQPISTQVLLGLLKNYSRPYDKINALVQKGYLIQIRKGLYTTSSLVSTNSPEQFLIANHLYGPSYISLESAMFYWGLIPERVFEIASVTNKLSKKFESNNQKYSFTHVPLPYYTFGIQQLSLTATQTVMIASKEKSICDKIITSAGIQLRSKKQAISYLVEDLRIEKDSLRLLNTREMAKWITDCPKQNTIKILIETIADL